MKSIPSIFLILLFISAVSCKKDEKNDPPADPCENVSCLNGGTCVDGTCDCPDHFFGSDCSEQETPTLIRVTKIDVTDFPPTDNGGAGWDLLDGPDIYVIVSKNGNVLWDSPIFYEDANPNNTYSFTPSPVINFDAPSEVYTVYLYDYDDFDADDFMGGINFTPYSSDNGFPDILIVDAGSGVAFRFHVEYLY